MHRYTKLVLASLTATAMLAMAVGSANANRIFLSLQTFRATWTSLNFSAAGATVSCPVTFEGSFHSATLLKTIGSLIGYVTRASVNGGSPPCTGGTATVRSETLPWHIRFLSFSGRLPRITLIKANIVGESFRFQPTGNIACNVRTEANHPAEDRIAIVEEGPRFVAQSLSAERSARIPLEEGLCAFSGEGSFEGTTQTLSGLGSTTRILIALI